MTMMTDFLTAKIRSHRRNIQRYSRLLAAPLPRGAFFLPVGAHPPRRQQPFSRLGDPHTRRLDSPIFVLEAFVPCDDQTALYQLN
jgi:hypothetical protein